MKTRIESDSMGELEIPEDAYYGVQTQRAVVNFPISGWKAFPEFILATVQIKKAAALANKSLTLLDAAKADAIVKACDEMIAGKYHDHVVVDVFQAGAGTSYHMNINEILANRGAELMGGKRGDAKLLSPNDHVNYGQSTNDIIPTSIRVMIVINSFHFMKVLTDLRDAFLKKGKEFDGIIKSGRTHLQDAVPIRLGQEFRAWGNILDGHINRYKRVLEDVKVLGIGGSAVGSGINTHPEYRGKLAQELSKQISAQFTVSEDLFAAMQSMSPFVAMSGVLRNLSLDMVKICNDIRLLSSGPNTGLEEIELPACQPGSSIMPAKVNPVMPEMLTMVCFQVMGNDQAIAYCSQAGQLELNVMMPLIAFDLMMSLKILENALRIFTTRCVEGITANAERCHHFAESSSALVTALNTHIGYLKAAAVGKEVLKTRKSIRQVVLEQKLMSEEDLKKALDLDAMTRATEKK